LLQIKILHIKYILVAQILCVLLVNPIFSFAQDDTLTHKMPPLQNDTSLVVKKKHSPTTASLLSTVVPGLGQAYNKKYWKIPIIYGGMGVLGYYSIKQNDSYQKYKEAYIYRTDTSAATVALAVFDTYTDSDLENIMNQYRRARDFNYVVMGVIYIFNIIDASVDAHLFDYDVSDDLSLKINPNYMVYNNRGDNYVGLSLTFTFK